MNFPKFSKNLNETIIVANKLVKLHMELNQLILDTPTSPERNSLTEANIHLMLAISTLNKQA